MSAGVNNPVFKTNTLTLPVKGIGLQFHETLKVKNKWIFRPQKQVLKKLLLFLYSFDLLLDSSLLSSSLITMSTHPSTAPRTTLESTEPTNAVKPASSENATSTSTPTRTTSRKSPTKASRSVSSSSDKEEKRC